MKHVEMVTLFGAQILWFDSFEQFLQFAEVLWVMREKLPWWGSKGKGRRNGREKREKPMSKMPYFKWQISLNSQNLNFITNFRIDDFPRHSKSPSYQFWTIFSWNIHSMCFLSEIILLKVNCKTIAKILFSLFIL